METFPIILPSERICRGNHQEKVVFPVGVGETLAPGSHRSNLIYCLTERRGESAGCCGEGAAGYPESLPLWLFQGCEALGKGCSALTGRRKVPGNLRVGWGGTESALGKEEYEARFSSMKTPDKAEMSGKGRGSLCGHPCRWLHVTIETFCPKAMAARIREQKVHTGWPLKQFAEIKVGTV